jgi:hypothetical protein
LINLRYATHAEIVNHAIDAAINKPDLAHFRTSLFENENGSGEAKITFVIADAPCGVALWIAPDKSFILTTPDEPKAVEWPTKQAVPATVTEAVISALRSRVRASK